MSMIRFWRFIVMILCLWSGSLLAHEAHHHPDNGEQGEQKKTPLDDNKKAERFREINNAYLQTVKPIFKRSCFACHAGEPQYPWYYGIPGIRQLLNYDTGEAKEHLDMTHDFPFEGHGTPKEDLEAIQESVEKNTMPPFRYRMMHWESGLTDEEKKAVLQWIADSQGKVSPLDRKEAVK